MKSCYERNGLVFWSEEEIRLRKMLEQHFVESLKACLRSQNRAFEFIQVEAPILTPSVFINANYEADDMFVLEDLILRPETTMGSYAYARHLLESQCGVRLPIVVWQHGKSFRREQDQPTKFMRLKEFYQLEFQCVYSPQTKNDYSLAVVPSVQQMIAEMIGDCEVVASDRLPSYAEWTKDVICKSTNMEVCSMSQRKDFEGAKVLEVAIGTDRCVYNFLHRRKK